MMKKNVQVIVTVVMIVAFLALMYSLATDTFIGSTEGFLCGIIAICGYLLVTEKRRRK